MIGNKITLSSAGLDGADAINGKHGASGAGYRIHGQDGTAAGTAGNGSDAGNLDLFIETTADEIHVLDRNTQQARVAPLSYRDVLEIKANGGQGGHGGVGGNGGDGANGKRGLNATRYSRAGNGTNGGDAGKAAPGSNGGDGGNGGKVLLTLKASDSDVLAMIGVDDRAGEGGRAGKHGIHGEFGRGGQGGGGASWSEIRGRYSSYNSRPGGYSGQSGRIAPRIAGQPAPGKAGHQGSTQYCLVSDDGTQQYYDYAYDLRFTPPQLEGAGVAPIEPGTILSLTSQVSNIRSMPAPQNISAIVLPTLLSETVQAAPIAAGLVGNEPQPLHIRFQVPYQNPTHGKRLDAQAQAQVGLHFSRLERDVPGRLELPSSLGNIAASVNYRVSVPVELSIVTADHTYAAPDYLMPVTLRVSNLSDETFGDKSKMRHVAVQISAADAIDDASMQPEQLMYQTSLAETAKPLSQAMMQRIASLAPHASVEFTGYISSAKQTPAYKRGTLLASLFLSSPDKSREVSVQVNEVTVQAVEPLQCTRSTGILVVTDLNTTAQEIAAWKKFAGKIGTSVAFWSMSLYGIFDLAVPAEGHDLASLMAHKTVVYPPSVFIAGAVNNKSASELADIRKESLIAAQQRDIGLVEIADCRRAQSDFLTTDADKYAVYRSMPFGQKFRMWADAQADGVERQSLGRSLLADLEAEQMRLRQAPWSVGISDEDFAKHMPNMRMLCARGEPFEPGSDLYNIMQEMLPKVLVMLEDSVSLWDKILPWRSAYDSAQVARGYVLRACEHNMGMDFTYKIMPALVVRARCDRNV